MVPLCVYAMLRGLQRKRRSKINETAITNLNLPIDLEKVGDSKHVITNKPRFCGLTTLGKSAGKR